MNIDKKGQVGTILIIIAVVAVLAGGTYLVVKNVVHSTGNAIANNLTGNAIAGNAATATTQTTATNTNTNLSSTNSPINLTLNNPNSCFYSNGQPCSSIPPFIGSGIASAFGY